MYREIRYLYLSFKEYICIIIFGNYAIISFFVHDVYTV